MFHVSQAPRSKIQNENNLTCVMIHTKTPLATALLFRAVWQMSRTRSCTHAETRTECTGHDGSYECDIFRTLLERHIHLDSRMN